MEIQAFGYLGVGSGALDDWAQFATTWVGMQAVERSAHMQAFRMDDRKQRLFVDPSLGDGARVFGWEVADAAALGRLAARLDNAGIPVRRGAAALADARRVAEVISFADPAGNRLEAFHGAQLADTPFLPGRTIGGFRTGPQGMGHTLVMVPDAAAALAFYQGLLGFRISDYMRAPVPAYFMHVNARHHSLALVQGPMSAIHHLMVEYFALDDVGTGYDIAQSEAGRIAVKLGRHPNDMMTSFYVRTPGDILVECGWGGREVDDATWQPVEMATIGSFWGHQGLFEGLGEEPPRTPGGAPVQVIEGNFSVMNGVCPWWDAQRKH